MTVSTWKMFTARGGHVFAALLRNKRQSVKHTHKGDLQQWEGEGGNLAPAAEATEQKVTTGSA